MRCVEVAKSVVVSLASSGRLSLPLHKALKVKNVRMKNIEMNLKKLKRYQYFESVVVESWS